MAKAELFDIRRKKEDQRKAEMAMKPEERLVLVLDLMDLSAAMSKSNQLPESDDDIKWIELRFRDE